MNEKLPVVIHAMYCNDVIIFEYSFFFFEMVGI